MKILLLGKSGQIGSELQRSLSLLGDLVALGKGEANFAELERLRQLVRQIRPNLVVNAAAYTSVDRAETDGISARRVNADAVRVLAEEALNLGAWLVHYSTDYVFDGRKTTPYIEDDAGAPLNEYGRTKLAGEDAIRKVGCSHLILRSSWVYSISGANFPKAILDRALVNEEIEVVSDCYGAPTSAELIADATSLALYRIVTDSAVAQTASGTYHIAASGEVSWYEYAKFLIALAKAQGLPLRVDRVLPVSSDKFESDAKRPKNSRLDTRKFSARFGLQFPEWRFHSSRFIKEMVRKRAYET